MDQGRTGTKLGAKHFIYYKLENFTQKRDIVVDRHENVISNM